MAQVIGWDARDVHRARPLRSRNCGDVEEAAEPVEIGRNGIEDPCRIIRLTVVAVGRGDRTCGVIDAVEGRGAWPQRAVGCDVVDSVGVLHEWYSGRVEDKRIVVWCTSGSQGSDDEDEFERWSNTAERYVAAGSVVFGRNSEDGALVVNCRPVGLDDGMRGDSRTLVLGSDVARVGDVQSDMRDVWSVCGFLAQDNREGIGNREGGGKRREIEIVNLIPSS
nr:hypothetical protein Iba_chr06aCG11470 [Ipomoea batatas]